MSDLVNRKAFTFRTGTSDVDGSDTVLAILANRNVGIGTTSSQGSTDVAVFGCLARGNQRHNEAKGVDLPSRTL